MAEGPSEIQIRSNNSEEGLEYSASTPEKLDKRVRREKAEKEPGGKQPRG